MMEIQKKQIELIKESWQIVAPNIYEFLLSFYNLFYEKVPSEIPIFKKDIRKESEKLLYNLGLIVSNLEDLNLVQNSIKEILDEYEQSYKPNKSHYGIMKVCFIESLKACMRSEYTKPHGISWLILIESIRMMLTEQGHETKKIQLLSWN